MTALIFIWDPVSTSMKWRMYQVFFFFFFFGGGTDKGLIKDFVLKFWNLCYFSFQLWLMKNKHQISLPIFRPEKNGPHFAHNIFKWIFLLKKYCLSFCLPLCLSVFLSVCLCLSHLFHYVPTMVSSWNFQEWLPMTEVMSMQKFKVRGTKSGL